MVQVPTRLLVAWSGAGLDDIRSLHAKKFLPVLAGRLTARDRLSPLTAPSVSPFALAISLITGVSPADHGLLAPVQPSPDGTTWEAAQASRLPAAPLWDRLSAVGMGCAAVGWPGTHDAHNRPRRALASDLDLAAVDPALRPLAPLAGDVCADLVRISPGELDPGLLGFFIPRHELPANPGADPAVRALLRHLAVLYSAHNTAITLLRSGTATALLAVHYALPRVPATALSRHPRLREAGLQLLDLLLGDLLRHTPGATLDVVGLAPGACFHVGPPDRPAPTNLTAIAPALLSEFGAAPGPPASAQTVPSLPDDETALLGRYHALGLSDDDAVKGPPSLGARLRHQTARGRLLLAEQRPAQALPLLAAMHFHHPENVAHALSLYECLHQLGLRDEARELVAALRDHAPAGPYSHLVEAQLLLRHSRQPARALPLLAALLDHPQFGPSAAPLYRETLLHLRRFSEARPLLEAAIAAGSATADTHAGLAYACFHLGELIPCETAARTARDLGSTRPQPARILEHLAARRAGRRAPAAAVPDWNDLLADASRRDELRVAYNTLRHDFVRARDARRITRNPLNFITGTPAPPSDAVWTLVTGAPRSGRALLLRMLALAGFPVLTDGIRPPDQHNPCGYFEWTPVAQLKSTPRLIDNAANHAVKLSPESLDYLPRDRRYRVLFVTRDPAEISRSEATVRGLKPAPAEAVADLTNHLARRLAHTRGDANFDVLEVPYHKLREHPLIWSERIADFLGRDRLRRPDAMPAAVHPDLPRHRS